MKIIQTNLVMDDIGEYWVYGNGRIRCVGDDSQDGGYPCDSFDDGIETLCELGYISESNHAG